MIHAIEGNCSAGKGIYTNKLMLADLEHAKYKNKKGKLYRKVATNKTLKKEFIDKWKDYIVFWKEPEELAQFSDMNIYWEEIANHLEATQWANLPFSFKVWIRQHAKMNLKIVADTQNFLTIDISFRRLVNKLQFISPFFQSERPSKINPNPKPYGISFIWNINPRTYTEQKREILDWLLPNILTIRKKYCYSDTLAKINTGVLPPYEHIERFCKNYNLQITDKNYCNYKHVIHR